MAKRRKRKEVVVIMRDTFIFEKQFDIEDLEEAEQYRRYCQSNYQGGFSLRIVSEDDFAKMLGCIDTPEYMTKVGEAAK